MTRFDLSTKERLLEAAICEFAERGFEQTTVRGICARAGANLNSVKYYFGDKKRLYLAALTDAQSSPNHLSELPADASQEPIEQLRSIVGLMVSMAFSDNQDSTPRELLILRELANPTTANEHVARSFFQPHFHRLDEILEQLVPPSLSTIERHLLAISVVGQCLHFRFGRAFDRLIISREEYQQFTRLRLTEHIMRVTMAAINDSCRESHVFCNAPESYLPA